MSESDVAIIAVSIAGEARVMVTSCAFMLIFGSVAVIGVAMGRRSAKRRET